MLRVFAAFVLAPIAGASLVLYLLLWPLGRKGRP